MLSLLLGTFLLFVSGGPDRVKLQNGKELEGRVVCERKDSVLLKQGHDVRTIARGDIAELATLERSLTGIVERDLGAADAAALREAARECAKAGLAADARLMWLRVLLRDGSDAEALAALDAKASKDDVSIPFGKHSHKLGSLRAAQAKWKDAYELPTTHFVLRTDLPLDGALDAALGLERFHSRFYELVGDPLALHVFDERQLPEIRLYARSSDLPVGPVKGETVWFAPLENVLHVDASVPDSLPAIVAELSRQMLFSSLRRGAGGTAQVQPWIAAGIAETFARSAPQRAGGEWRSPRTADKASFERAAASKLGFTAVFQATHADFTTGARASEFSACGSTLLHFFIEGRDGQLRAGFGKYVAEGAKGKLSTAALSECVGLSTDAIETAWREHIAQHAR